MRITIGRVAAELSSDSPAIAAHWERASKGIAAAGGSGSHAGPVDEVEIVIRLEEASDLPASPEERPAFAGQATGLPDGVGGLAVHRCGDAHELFFSAGAWAGIHFLGEAARPAWRVDCLLRPEVLSRGRLDDVFFTALAAPLRHFGVYLVHGFGATCRGRALLLMGPSGSGKTTAGLSLLGAGWHFLGNDVVALQAAGRTIQALPTPSLVGVLHLEEGDPAARNYQLDTAAVRSWGRPSPVAGLLFLESSGMGGKQPEEINRTIAVARLMESSLDRWDEPAVGEHIAFLERLARQAPGYRLASAEVGSYAAESFAATWKW